MGNKQILLHTVWCKKKTKKYHINKTTLKLLCYKYYLLPTFVEFDVRVQLVGICDDIVG